MHDRATAAAELAQLETALGTSLRDVPIHLVDQWGAGVRDMLRGLGVERLDKDASRAALGGAYLVATLALGESVIPQSNLTAVAHVLRWLYDRGEENSG